MLIEEIDELLKRIEDRYLLVIVASKRAYQLMKGGEKLVDINSNKVTSITLAELAKGKIDFKEYVP